MDTRKNQTVHEATIGNLGMIFAIPGLKAVVLAFLVIGLVADVLHQGSRRASAPAPRTVTQPGARTAPATPPPAAGPGIRWRND